MQNLRYIFLYASTYHCLWITRSKISECLSNLLLGLRSFEIFR